MKVLELGNYIIPAYAGMVLAEQGFQVDKWTRTDGSRDPILDLKSGEDLWAWINYGKHVRPQDAASVADLKPGAYRVIIDNFRPEFWQKLAIDPEREAKRIGCSWVSMRADVGDTSFDILAQARSWMEYGPYVPFYIGDTAGGLWLAFKALSVAHKRPGHHAIYHAACLQKMVEGELILDPQRNGRSTPWDEESNYGCHGDGVHVNYRGRAYREPVRTRDWKLEHLRHANGRILI